MKNSSESPEPEGNGAESAVAALDAGEEKRKAKRFTMRLPVSVTLTNGGTHQTSGVTRDVGAGGAYFYLDPPVGQGAEVEYVLSLPRELLLMESVRVRYRGRVVRVEPAPGDQVGVAAVSTHFEYV